MAGISFGDCMDDWGVDIKTGVAGMVGGFFAWLAIKELTSKQLFISTMGGFSIAMYCTHLFVHYFSIPVSMSGGVGFALGLFGMGVFGKILMIINSLTKDDLKELTVQWIKTVIEPIVGAFKKGGDK